MNVFELIKNKIISHCDERKYDYRLGKGSIDYLVKDLIKDFESNNGWILCNERLPDEEGEYLTYVNYDGHRFISIDEFLCEDFLRDWNRTPSYSVIAWQPLPAPYKEGHTDEYIKGYNQGTVDRADEIQKAREYGYNKAVDEFAEKLKRDYQAYDIDLCLQDNDHLSYTNSCTALESYIDEIAEQLKGGSNNV